MKIEFVIESIERKRYSPYLELTLSQYIPPKPPEPIKEEPTPPDPIETFVPESDGEKLLVGFLKGMRKMGYDPFPPPRASVVAPRACYGRIDSKLALKQEDYKKLGKPGLGQRIKVTMEKVAVQ